MLSGKFIFLLLDKKSSYLVTLDSTFNRGKIWSSHLKCLVCQNPDVIDT